ncbi:TIGR02234 family membrane protein [Mycobacterium sp. CVI_P3]|uniref:TIGR02234 family membrane protein n=1 Tax=Mycobacterium pinniadriaticum TaxID=2994102 RepID=A0ABT3SBB6_9MYCO|nr:TIGR02234 family membrane protein [Mycobacterium pinniadriaticum]MCX2930140.1 TIGR02234 family membrane protein [Mycobacterium pinniadriaticum]MCX2936798.1 TIGR02234 family membrane protein [Mycobacterium pinniadriaticum]
MIRIGQLLLVVAAVLLWVASRLTWVSVTSFDGLGQPKTLTLSGAGWSNALLPLAVLLLAAAAAGLAVRGWSLRVVAVLVAVVTLLLGYLGVSLIVTPDVGPRGAALVGVPLASLVASDRQYLGAGLTVAAAVCALVAAVLMMRAAASGRGATAKYAAPAARRGTARSAEADPAMSERGMWDALDEGVDPTERHIDTEGR